MDDDLVTRSSQWPATHSRYIFKLASPTISEMNSVWVRWRDQWLPTYAPFQYMLPKSPVFQGCLRSISHVNMNWFCDSCCSLTALTKDGNLKYSVLPSVFDDTICGITERSGVWGDSGEVKSRALRTLRTGGGGGGSSFKFTNDLIRTTLLWQRNQQHHRLI
jgi:hypothetical protein